MLLVEAAQNYARGQVGCKSSCLAARQKGNAPAVIEYADKANERLRRKYDRLTLKNGKKANVTKTAVARELASFIWGMKNHSVLPVSRLLRTVDAAAALTLPSRCDGG